MTVTRISSPPAAFIHRGPTSRTIPITAKPKANAQNPSSMAKVYAAPSGQQIQPANAVRAAFVTIAAARDRKRPEEPVHPLIGAKWVPHAPKHQWAPIARNARATPRTLQVWG